VRDDRPLIRTRNDLLELIAHALRLQLTAQIKPAARGSGVMESCWPARWIGSHKLYADALASVLRQFLQRGSCAFGFPARVPVAMAGGCLYSGSGWWGATEAQDRTVQSGAGAGGPGGAA
jgi:hypothetical protein